MRLSFSRLPNAFSYAKGVTQAPSWLSSARVRLAGVAKLRLPDNLSLPDVETLAPILGQLTFGALAGFAAGYALKKIGKLAALALGIFFILIQLMAYYGLVEVNWLRIQQSVDPLLRPESLDGLWRSLVAFLTLNLPFAAAFVPGLLVGLRRG